MKVRYIGEAKEREGVAGNNIAIDTVFGGTVGGFSSIFLRTYNKIVDLKNPNNTWGTEYVFVANYRELDVELVVNN